MKKAILIIIVVVAAFFIYNYLRTGNFTLIPSGTASEEEKELEKLESELRSAEKQALQAERSAGVSGMDTSGDMAQALQMIQRVEKQLESMKRITRSEIVKSRIRQLEDEIDQLKKKLG